MNNQLIAKVIKYNNKSCPDFVFSNPLLDKNLARLLSKSFVNILTVSNANTNVNNNLRHCILENIRRLCQSNSDGHIKVDENFYETLVDLYKNHIEDKQNTQSDTLERKLDIFLLRRLCEDNLNTNYQPHSNPELIQALINIEAENITDTIYRDVIYWDQNNLKCKNILNELWDKDCSSSTYVMYDVSIKMKTDIEKIVLNLVLQVLSSEKIVDEFISSEHQHLIKMCAKISQCFQITCKILNHLFINTNFNLRISELIIVIIKLIKLNCLDSYFSSLYPENLQSIVILLDFEIDLISAHKNIYLKNVIKQLQHLKTTSENDVVMLLSHFPDWFDIYYENNVIESQ